MTQLVPGYLYHIYNRGNNRETIFRCDENYRFFLHRYAHYIEPVAATYAYCLLPNHFHLLVRIREEERLPNPSRAFANLFTSYAKAFNRRYDRSGSLFLKPFKRKLVESHGYALTLVRYIHRNPQMHGIVEDFRDWAWSSYHTILSPESTRLQRETLLAWYDDDVATFEAEHRTPLQQDALKTLRRLDNE